MIYKSMRFIFCGILFMVFGSGCLSKMVKELHRPAEQGKLEKVQLALQNGYSVDERDVTGRTPLMYASLTGQIPVMEYLVAQGADVNALMTETKQNQFLREINWFPASPLMHAALQGRVEAFQYLLDKGADPNLTASSGATAMKSAQKTKKKEIIAILNQLDGSTVPTIQTTPPPKAERTKPQKSKKPSLSFTSAPIFVSSVRDQENFDVNSSVAASLKKAHGVNAKANKSDCTSVSCLLNEAQKSNAKILVVVETTSIMGIYNVTLSLYDVEDQNQLASKELDGTSLSDLDNIFATTLPTWGIRFFSTLQ